MRVVARDGTAVRDLTREDFTVLEDGVRQTIEYFELVDRGRDKGADGTPVSGTASMAANRPRNFVFVLGRGRLQHPAKGLDAILAFVRHRTLPSDRLAVAAYDRISELTTEREPVLRLIERYRERYEYVEALLDHWFSGLTLAYGSSEPPSGAQAKIDSLFDFPGVPPLRSLTVLPPDDVVLSAYERDMLLRALREGDDGSKRGFVYNASARQDLEKLHAAVEYLRLVDGEKHVILISTEGLLGLMPSASERLVRLAADARVSLSIIHTGGIATSWMRSGRSVIFQGPSWRQLDANANSRLIAEDTGGIASTYEYADRTLERIERATQVQYLLGTILGTPPLTSDSERYESR